MKIKLFLNEITQKPISTKKPEFLRKTRFYMILRKKQFLYDFEKNQFLYDFEKKSVFVQF